MMMLPPRNYFLMLCANSISFCGFRSSDFVWGTNRMLFLDLRLQRHRRRRRRPQEVYHLLDMLPPMMVVVILRSQDHLIQVQP